MTNELWARTQAVFERVCTAPARSRAALLDEACGDDAALRAEVESLLKYDSAADDSILSSPLAAIRRPPAEPEGWAAGLVGQTIGRYTLVRLIATGGMGCVYEARQEHPTRSVALKVLRPGFSAPSALARFRLEPEILGRLQHPNIAQVYEAGMHDPHDGRAGATSEPRPQGSDPNRDREGAAWRRSDGATERRSDEVAPDTPGGLPYFALELIPDAQPLDQFADEQQLSTHDRLALFVKVCDALHHGHQKGIIHRDLKPGNILVGRDGEPKVIDFGVARATDGDIVLTTQYTHIGDLIGTLRYMSPEQCDGDPAAIDTRSDIYSLGVVLYELLTGVPPYETTGTTVYTAVQVIKDEPPRRPSTVVGCGGHSAHEIRAATARERSGGHGPLARELRGNLDAILLKALEKDPARRYASAADLAADIRRHLTGEPIAARPPTVFTHAIRWALRHPVWATAGACAPVVGVALLAVALGAWYLNFRLHKVEHDEDGREIRLLAINGRQLAQWRSEVRAFGPPKLVKRPSESSGGRLLVFGSMSAPGNPTPHGLLVYEVDRDYDEPLWIGRLEPNDIPPKLAQRTDDAFEPEHFWPQKLLVADVFPGHPPGMSEVPEIVALYQQVSTTHTAIRVHSLTGDVLYQSWIDANIGVPDGMVWLPRAGLLVFAGVNGEAFLEERGYLAPVACPHPTIVFAIAPQLDGVRRREYIPQEEEARAAAEGPLRCAWYYCVSPHDGLEIWPAGLSEATRGSGAEAVCFDVAIGPGKPYQPGLRWYITAGGELDGDRPYPSDSYQRNQTLPEGDPEKLPPPENFKLGPLPPILHPASRPAP